MIVGWCCQLSVEHKPKSGSKRQAFEVCADFKVSDFGNNWVTTKSIPSSNPIPHPWLFLTGMEGQSFST